MGADATRRVFPIRSQAREPAAPPDSAMTTIDPDTDQEERIAQMAEALIAHHGDASAASAFAMRQFMRTLRL